jgi:hypothetical protein
MISQDVEHLFFRPAPTSAAEVASRRRESSESFQSPPVRTENAPYHLNLAAILPTRTG